VTEISALDLMRVFARPLAASLCMSAIVYLVRQALQGHVSSLAILLAMMGVGAIIYAICLLVFDKNIRMKVSKLKFWRSFFGTD
jgi:hypothetical protein